MLRIHFFCSDMAGRVSLDLTHVIYDASSHTSFLLALLSLSPILLMPAYAVLAIQTRELTIINMWAGQLLSECLNLILKHMFKEDRPVVRVYSNHFMGGTGGVLEVVMSTDLSSRELTRFYRRLHLLYHTSHQVIWGLGIGVFLGTVHYVVTELLPYQWPLSPFGRARTSLLTNPIVDWMQIRDGWAIWPDGGREVEWKHWKDKYNERQSTRRRID
ncbi:hypothetical protein ID866_7197 [Astraeus odoratus]|nr:hypothetical protein ID866_7197 [Astraeus odoratus]